MTRRQMLWQVELPLAMRVIMAGVRVAAVTSVGVATIAAAVGGGGLGTFIFQGLTMVNNNVILAGAIPTAILALLANAAFGWIERRLSAALGTI
jgi:osmoprotectant transport system permease protein